MTKKRVGQKGTPRARRAAGTSVKARTSRRGRPERISQRDDPGDDEAVAPAARVSVVGVGASAGGLEAFTALLRGLPDRPGIALVFVQHLAPQHESALVPLLSAHTQLPVVQAEEGMKVEVERIQIFATDVSEAAIEQARSGVYPTSIEADVSLDRLRRFFVKHDGGYPSRR